MKKKRLQDKQLAIIKEENSKSTKTESEYELNQQQLHFRELVDQKSTDI